MTDKPKQLKGYLVLPEATIYAPEIKAIHDPGLPDELLLKICPQTKAIKPHCQISLKGEKGVFVIHQPYVEVMRLFVEALEECTLRCRFWMRRRAI